MLRLYRLCIATDTSVSSSGSSQSSLSFLQQYLEMWFSYAVVDAGNRVVDLNQKVADAAVSKEGGEEAPI